MKTDAINAKYFLKWDRPGRIIFQPPFGRKFTVCIVVMLENRLIAEFKEELSPLTTPTKIPPMMG